MTFGINRIGAASAAAAAALVLLVGCGTSTTTASNSAASTAHSYSGIAASPAAGAPASMMPSSPGAGMPMPAAPAGPHQQADVTFAQQMTIHHQGAITMSDLAATRASSPAVKTLATQIKAAQAPEIKEMTSWLAAWAPGTDMNGMPTTTAASAGDMGGMSGTGSGTSSSAMMPGMMTDAQMAKLAAASGPAFDKLFLQLMITHHQGALTMAQTETAQGGNPAALTLAKSITTSQTAQITQMQNMLKGM